MNRVKNQTYDLAFYTQYSQFNLVSNGKNSLDDLTFEAYSELSQSKRLIAGDHGLIILTGCYGHVKSRLILSNSMPLSKLESTDHIVEGSIIVDNETLEILDCPHFETELKINVPNGPYRVRVSSSNLDTVIGDDGDDFYTIEIWPAPSEDIVVLKQYKNE